MNWSNNIEVFNESNMIVMGRYPDNYFDLAIVDPPYGIKKDGRKDMGKRKKSKNYTVKNYIAKKWDEEIPPEEYFVELKRVSKNWIVWGGNYFCKYFERIDKLIEWDKCCEGMSFSQFEIAFTSFDGRNEKIKIPIQAESQRRIHPTQKPVTLYKWLLLKYAKKGDKILDTHFGSGSHGIALDSVNKIEKIELTLVAPETDKEYYNQSKERFEKETAWQSIF